MPLTLPVTARTCIWRAHGKRCVYCGELINFAQLEIDHIIPERLERDSNELSKVLSDLGLPADFDLNSLRNLVPAHPLCNREKGDHIFDSANARFFLERAAMKESAVRECLEAMKLQIQKDNLLAGLASGLDAGSLNASDIFATFRGSGSFALGRGIQFADGSEESQIAQHDIDVLLDKPILIGGGAEFVAEFVNSAGNKMTVHTCREYRAAKAAKFQANTTYDIKSEAFLSAADAVLTAVARAQLATISYVSNPYVGVADLRLLPKTLLPQLSPDNETAIAAMEESSLEELVVSGEIEIVRVASRSIEFRWGGMGVGLSELLRADIDGDGAEELLVQYYKYAIKGTFGHGSIGVLRRNGPDEMFVFTAWS